MKKPEECNKAIKFAPFGRRTLVPRAVYGGRYAKQVSLCGSSDRKVERIGLQSATQRYEWQF